MTHAEEELAFFHELGLAICNWNFVESAIYKIMTALADSKDHVALGFGFFAVDNFRAKLSFADAFIKKKLQDAARLDEWSKFVTRLGKTVVKRNRLAHDRLFFYKSGDAGRRYALEQWPTDKPRKSKLWTAPTKPPDSSLCLRDVVSCKRDFYYLSRELQNFHATLLGQKIPHPEVHERAERPPTIRAIRNQMYEELGLQPKPSRKKP